MEATQSSRDASKSDPRSRSRPNLKDRLPGVDRLRPGAGPGETYVALFGPPALAESEETYFQIYASVRAILRQLRRPDPIAAIRAFCDALCTHLNRRGRGGGEER
jgi:hypothetical protein